MHDDSYLRKAAIKAKFLYMTTIAAARATAKGIKYVKEHGNGEVKSIQELHSEIKQQIMVTASDKKYLYRFNTVK